MPVTENLRRLCERLIAVASVTTSGTRAIAEFCARDVLAPAGIQAELVCSDTDGPEQVNLIANVLGRDSECKPLLLNTHLDTVPAGDLSAWTSCAGKPWNPRVEGDRIFGLGAADTKLDFAAKAMALIGCKRPRRTTYLIGSFGEEHGLRGAKELARRGLLPGEGLAFVGEPSNLQVITAHKGLLVFELIAEFDPMPLAAPPATVHRVEFVGKAAHSSTPQLGVNAISMALEALAKAHPRPVVVSFAGGDAVNKVPARCEVVLSAAGPRSLPAPSEVASAGWRTLIDPAAIEAVLTFIKRLEKYARDASVEEQDYAMPTLTCNPGVIKSSPSQLVLQFELRPPPSLPMTNVVAGVEELLAELEHGRPGLRFKVAQSRANPGFRSPAGSEAVVIGLDAMARAGLRLDSGVKAGCTEAGIYAAAGLQPVVFGPGLSVGVVHAPNEYNLLSQVEAATRFYRELLEL